LTETCEQLNSKCARMARTLSTRDIQNAQNISNLEIQLSQARTESLNKTSEMNLLKQQIFKLDKENQFLQKKCENMEKLQKENEKCKMMVKSYKSELDNLVTEANQKQIIETQQKVGNILLEKIDDLLSKKTISGNGERYKKI